MDERRKQDNLWPVTASDDSGDLALFSMCSCMITMLAALVRCKGTRAGLDLNESTQETFSTFG